MCVCLWLGGSLAVPGFDSVQDQLYLNKREKGRQKYHLMKFKPNYDLKKNLLITKNKGKLF